MNRSTVQKRLASYEGAQVALTVRREALRHEVVAWKERGATIVEIAKALNWSRQSVYDLIREPTEDEVVAATSERK